MMPLGFLKTSLPPLGLSPADPEELPTASHSLACFSMLGSGPLALGPAAVLALGAMATLCHNLLLV
eukprot:1176611-Alexandrium_andersonii.AAC.1